MIPSATTGGARKPSGPKKSVLTMASCLDQFTQNNAVHGDMKKGKFGKLLLNKISIKRFSYRIHQNKIETEQIKLF